MTNPYRAMCAELLQPLAEYDGANPYHEHRALIIRARTLLDQQEPDGADIHYAWELLDAEGDWQAGGSANSLEDVQREGNCYLRALAQYGPHTLIIQRVSTIEEATNA